MAGGPWERLFAAKYSPIRSRETGGTCVEDECDSMVVTVVTDDGEEPPSDEDDEQVPEDDVDAATESWCRAVASGEDAIMINVDDAAAILFRGGGTTIGRWLRRGIPPRGGAPVGGGEGISSGGIRVGFARRNVLVLRAKQEETVEPYKNPANALSLSLARAPRKGIGVVVDDSVHALSRERELLAIRLRSLSHFFFSSARSIFSIVCVSW